MFMKRMMACAMLLTAWITGFADALADTPKYCVIDLSGGGSVETFPVTYLDDVPEGGWTTEHKTTKLVLRHIPAGTFMMGSPADEPGSQWNEPYTQVTLTQDFWIGVFEITPRQRDLIMTSDPAVTGSGGASSDPLWNVEYVDIRGSTLGSQWPANREVDATSFMGKLRNRVKGAMFDLPTEAQWEYACRAGTTTGLNNGKEVQVTGYTPDLEHYEICPNLQEVGVYRSIQDCGDPNDVGWKKPNAWGLYDMHGNLHEWCLDWYGDIGSEAVTDPKGPATGDCRVIRGGCCHCYAHDCRSASRKGLEISEAAYSVANYGDENYNPDYFPYYVGFRVAAPYPLVQTFDITTESLPDAVECEPYSVQLESSLASTTWEIVNDGSDIQVLSELPYEKTGEALDWTANPLPLPFEFPYFGETYTNVWILGNGGITFGRAPESSYGPNSEEIGIWTGYEILHLEHGGVFVDAQPDHVTIRWDATTWDENPMDRSITLYANGEVVVSFENATESENSVAFYNGHWETVVESQSGPTDKPQSFLLSTSVPEGLTLSESGLLSGTPVAEPGTYGLWVRALSGSETVMKRLPLTVLRNPLERPEISGQSPVEPLVSHALGESVHFSVAATHPTSEALDYTWLLDGETVGTESTYTFIPINDEDRVDRELHRLECFVSSPSLTKNERRTWSVGVFDVQDPVSQVEPSFGQNVRIPLAIYSAYPYSVEWFEESNPTEVIGWERDLQLDAVTANGTYRARVTSEVGSRTTSPVTVAVKNEPSVGRIYKLTGPIFVGNRLVLRAKGYGAAPLMYVWKRNGNMISTSERLEIPALREEDFGTYTLTVGNPYGTVVSEAFEVRPAAAGTVLGWGADGHGRTLTPEGLTGVAQVASGMNFNLALSTNGTVTAWGYNEHGGCDVPEGLTDVSSITAGGAGSAGAGFAVKTDGTVVGWGRSYDEYTYGYWSSDYWDSTLGTWVEGEPYWQEYSYREGLDTVTTIPSTLANVVQVAVSDTMALALKADGTLEAWSERTDEVGTPIDLQIPSEAVDIVAIAARYGTWMALRSDGKIILWDRWEGTSIREDIADPVAIAMHWQAIALSADGTLSSWGFSEYNRSFYAKQIGAVAVAASTYSYVTLDANGTLLYDLDERYQRENPPLVTTGILGIAAGGYHFQAIVPDTDGDGVCDALEADLGRDPNNASDGGARAVVSGTVLGDGIPLAGARMEWYGAQGTRLLHRQTTNAEGSYRAEHLEPGLYRVKVMAEGYGDLWYDHTTQAGEATPYRVLPGATLSGLDFELTAGQSPAYAYVTSNPSGAEIYLNLQPTGLITPAMIEVGECESWDANGNPLLRHVINVKGLGWPLVAPQTIHAAETECVELHFDQAAESESLGSVQIESDPAGATVYLDYGDDPIGVTPLTVRSLSQKGSGHLVILRKDGYLLPKPIVFGKEAEVIRIPLTPLGDVNAMSVAVSTEDASELDVFLDYIATGEVTPIVVEHLDVASHASAKPGAWHSASHSIMLRKRNCLPYAPRGLANCPGAEQTILVSPTIEAPIAEDLRAPFEFTASGYEGVYDGEPHGIQVAVTAPTEGVSITYRVGAEGAWSQTPPSFTDAGTATVWFQLSAPDLNTSIACAEVTIQPRPVTLQSLDGTWIYDGEPHSKPVIEVKDGSFVAGDTPSYSAFAEITQLGQTTNTFSVNFASPRVAGNYALTLLQGTLVVRERTLAEALDTEEAAEPPILWTTGGDAPWSAQTEETADGTDAAQSGTIADGEESWLEATLSGSGTLSFQWRVSSEDRFDNLILEVDGVIKTRLSGESEWEKKRVVLSGSGEHHVRWRYVKGRSGAGGLDAAWLDDVHWAPLTLEEALDTPAGIRWTTFGDAEWFPQADETSDGIDAAQSGPISDLGTSRLQLSVVGPQRIRFRWKVSSEELYDWLDFLVDEKLIDSITGEMDWTTVEFDVPEGEHTLTWVYWKDELDEEDMTGLDCGWLDCVQVVAREEEPPSDHTTTSPEPVPYTWLEKQAGVRTGATAAEYEAASLSDEDRDGKAAWEEYVAGTDPQDTSSVFRATIEMVGDTPVISWEPDLGEARVYRIEGRERLEPSCAWEPVDYERHHFFRVLVDTPKAQ